MMIYVVLDCFYFLVCCWQDRNGGELAGASQALELESRLMFGDGA